MPPASDASAVRVADPFRAPSVVEPPASCRRRAPGSSNAMSRDVDASSANGPKPQSSVVPNGEPGRCWAASRIPVALFLCRFDSCCSRLERTGSLVIQESDGRPPPPCRLLFWRATTSTPPSFACSSDSDLFFSEYTARVRSMRVERAPQARPFGRARPDPPDLQVCRHEVKPHRACGARRSPLQ
jgi:hypothetical protein